MSEYGLMSDKTNMETLLAGVALIPTEDHMEQFISFRKQCGENVSGPILSLETNLPHVTILQCPFKISKLKETQLQGILQQFLTVNPNHSFTSTYGSLYYQPLGWYFVDINMKNWGTVLQNITLENLQQHINKNHIVIDGSYKIMPPLEQHNQKAYGYRYMGEAYRPHITLGIAFSNTVTTVPSNVQKVYKNVLYGNPISFDRMVFYIAGEYGSASKIIAEIVLP